MKKCTFIYTQYKDFLVFRLKIVLINEFKNYSFEYQKELEKQINSSQYQLIRDLFCDP